MTDSRLALMLSGGGARAAYQVGFLRHLATRYPDIAPGILTGVSAGGLIAIQLASRAGNFSDAVVHLSQTWQSLHVDDVFRVDPRNLASRVTRWGFRLVSGGIGTNTGGDRLRSLVDTEPLRALLHRALDPAPDDTFPGIERNLATRRLAAVALTASSYTTGQSVTWVQNREGYSLLTMEGAQRTSVPGSLRIDHVMATSALPFFFPAIEVDGSWYGDGGIRLTAPLSTAIHLGADRIIAVSTRYARTAAEAGQPAVSGYPPPAQVAGVLYNAIFLDLLDADALRLQQVNQLVERLPRPERRGWRRIDLLVLRPSRDLGRLANDFEAALPRGLRFLLRGLGSRQTRSNDLLSRLMFQADYIGRLMELGEADARARSSDIDAFLGAASQSARA